MASFGQDFLKGFFGSDYLKDYKHASKTFLSNGSELLPRQKFLFHVYFTLNIEQIPALRSQFAGESAATISLLVKSIQLPNFQVSIDELNQYNRKRLIQKKIEYQPCQIVFHDDSKDMVRRMWYNYFTYYYKDSAHKYDLNDQSTGGDATPPGFSYNDRDIYANERLVNDWGFVGESPSDGTSSKSGKPSFFRDIRIFGMSQKKYAEYVLINPMIEQWQHDNYDYSEQGGLLNTMSVKYEAVKYRAGAINGSTGAPIPGFAQPNYYDKSPSSLGRPGATRSILGPGGLLDAGLGVAGDLENGNYLNAILTAGRTATTFKGADFKGMAQTEAITAATGILRSGIGDVRQSPSGGGFTFPKPPTNPINNGGSSGAKPF
jgi:hypothetical protein